MEDAVDLQRGRQRLPFLENKCERRWLEGRVGSVGVSEGVTEVEMELHCPDLCNGKGCCVEWGVWV